jgi:hypothetical protein
MAEHFPLRICVLSLTVDQLEELKDEELCSWLINGGISSSQSRYGTSPDDWHPFDSDRSIISYLKAARFEPNSLSFLVAHASDVKSREALGQQVDLYLIDAIFLTVEAQQALLSYLDSVIRHTSKHYCIIFGGPPPVHVVKRLQEMRDRRLPLVKLIQKQWGEWAAKDEERLETYLGQLHFQLADGPVLENLDILHQILAKHGARSGGLSSVPALGGR